MDLGDTVKRAVTGNGPAADCRIERLTADGGGFAEVLAGPAYHWAWESQAAHFLSIFPEIRSAALGESSRVVEVRSGRVREDWMVWLRAAAEDINEKNGLNLSRHKAYEALEGTSEVQS